MQYQTFVSIAFALTNLLSGQANTPSTAEGPLYLLHTFTQSKPEGTKTAGLLHIFISYLQHMFIGDLPINECSPRPSDGVVFGQQMEMNHHLFTQPPTVRADGTRSAQCLKKRPSFNSTIYRVHWSDLKS